MRCSIMNGIHADRGRGRQIAANRQDPHYQEYMQELRRRLPLHAQRAYGVSKGAIGSPEWYRAIGGWWADERRRLNITIEQAAAADVLSSVEIRLLEAGLALDEELARLPRYATDALRH